MLCICNPTGCPQVGRTASSLVLLLCCCMRVLFALLFLPAVVLTTGCGSMNPNIPPAPLGPSADTNTIATRSRPAPLGGPLRHSDFLSTYDDLAPLPGRAGVESYRSARLSDFHSFIVDPVVVLPTRSVSNFAITPMQRDQLAADLQSEVRENLRLAGKLAVSNSPGPGIGRLRSAVTEIGRNIRPNGAQAGQIGGATVEAEVLDSVSGERLGAVIISETVSESNEMAPERRDQFRDVRIVFSSWAARLLKWLEPEGTPAMKRAPEAAAPAEMVDEPDDEPAK